ncbi:MAG: hypothetical protein RLZ98_39 [Pseudomonadota bacterium]|jgi:putative glutathione S-transferase
MGLLIDGVWHDERPDQSKSGGRFVRKDSAFRNWITPDGSPGPTGAGGFQAEPGRYHLYVSYACPWAHRTLIVRKLKGLEDVVSYDVVHPINIEKGWSFAPGFPGSTGDRVNAAATLADIYCLADKTYTGRVTVPVLWDRKRNTIVNNESSEIIRMMNTAFASVGAGGPDLVPGHLEAEIDSINSRVYADINNGVYRCGFATTQEAYEEAFHGLFLALDWLDHSLARQRYLLGNRATEADWRLFPTLVRFDPVYYSHFKCNLRRISDYPNLSGYLRDLYQTPGIAETVSIEHIKTHYYGAQQRINPTGIVPIGPIIELESPHERGLLS